MIFGSNAELKKVKSFLKKILESSNLKLLVYKMVILPSQEIAIHRLSKIIRNSNPQDKKITGKKILFNSVDGRYMIHTYFEGGLAKSLQMKGHEVKMLICGGALNMCTSHFTIKKPPNSWSCKNCVYFSKKFYETTGLPYSTYKDYIKEEELEAIKNKVNEMPFEECTDLVYKDIKVGLHAKISADRYFTGATVEKEQYEHVLRSELINAIISTDAAEKVLNKEKPDVMVNSHGCYSSWGSFTDYFRNKGIRVCVWYTGYKKNSVIFDMHKLDDYFKKYYTEIIKKRPLNEKEEQELNLFLNKRTKGEEGDTALYGFSKEKKDLEKQFNFDKYDKNYVMFPNVAWDAAVIDVHKAFKDVYEWVSYTIELFKEKPKSQLIIKIHPAEMVHESKGSVSDYINNTFASLPKNITIIPPDTNISPYSLFPFIDIGIVYNGTIGLEMVLQGIPVVVAGIAHYNRKRFTFDVSTKNEYANILFKEIPHLQKQQDLAKIYAYFYFIKSYVPRNFVYYKNFLNLGWNINSLDDFTEGNDEYLDHMCNYIVNGGVYQDW